MLTVAESTKDIKRYLKKLLNLIENEPVFIFFNTRLIDTKRIDDILCCIESSFPEEYKKFIQVYGENRLKTPKKRVEMISAIKNRFFLTPTLCSVRFIEAKQAIQDFINSIDSDMSHIMDINL